jgi:hypothetical protein
MDGKLEMTPVMEAPPREIDVLAERCVLHVKNRFGFELDYSVDTVSVLDHFVRTLVREEARGEIPPPGDRARSPLVHLLAPSVGAYFGEVLRRAFPARWRFAGDGPMEWALEFEEFFLRFNPAGAAAEVVMGEPVPDWGGAIATSPELTVYLHERLAAAPPVAEEEFYSFTSRHEAIQIAREYLLERAARVGPVGCSEEDYDRAFMKI